MAARIEGHTLSSLTASWGKTWRHLVNDSQLRWIGPEKGAILYYEREIIDTADSEPICTSRQTLVCRGNGGCGSPNGKMLPPHEMPQRKPDRRFGQGCPAGLSIAKSADAENPGATQHNPKQRAQSARSRPGPLSSGPGLAGWRGSLNAVLRTWLGAVLLAVQANARGPPPAVRRPYAGRPPRIG